MALLGEIATALEGLNVRLLLVGHCCFCALAFRATRSHFLLNYWVGLLGAVGGGLVSALLLQDPKAAPSPLLSANTVLLTWSACWWLVTYFPGDVVAQLVGIFPVKAACRACVNVLRAGTMVARVDTATRLYPGVWTAPLLLGTIGATGGKFLSDALLTLSGRHSGATELTQPGFAWRSGFLGTLLYYTTVHTFQSLAPREGKALITGIFIAHGLLADLTGWPLDFTAPIARLAHALTNVPMPQAPPKPAAAAAGAGAGAKAEAKKDK